MAASSLPATAGRKAPKDGSAKEPSRRALRGLDWLNFLLADVQTGVGPFLAIYLAGYGWDEQRVGIALTVGGIAGILTQTPAGALVDHLRSKRALIAAAIVALATGALLIAFLPNYWSVMSAQALIGGTSSVFGPAICAVSLGIVGHQLFDRRQGRNQAFNSAGNVAAAVSMGLLGYFVSNRSIFFFIAICAFPTILTLLLIRPEEIDYERARAGRKATKTANQSARAHSSKIGRCLFSSFARSCFILPTPLCCPSWARCWPRVKAEGR
jgi:MFS family permease